MHMITYSYDNLFNLEICRLNLLEVLIEVGIYADIYRASGARCQHVAGSAIGLRPSPRQGRAAPSSQPRRPPRAKTRARVHGRRPRGRPSSRLRGPSDGCRRRGVRPVWAQRPAVVRREPVGRRGPRRAARRSASLTPPRGKFSSTRFSIQPTTFAFVSLISPLLGPA